MELLDIAIEAYRWVVGFALLVFTYTVLKRIFLKPILDEMEEPDYMVKVHWRTK